MARGIAGRAPWAVVAWVIALVLLACALAGCDGNANHVAQPRVVTVTDFGAAGDGAADDTAALQAALEAGRRGAAPIEVRVPAGTYQVRPLTMYSRTTLRLEAGAVLVGSARVEDYPVAPMIHNSREQMMPASLITAVDAMDVAIIGEGIIDGSGAVWWERFLAEPADAKTQRPRLVEFRNCRNVRVDGVTLRNSPGWTLHPVDCMDVTITNMTAWAPQKSPNTDGIIIDSCVRVQVAHCTVDSGDDLIVVKSGKDEPGRLRARPSTDVLIEHCRLGYGFGGVAVGSEMSGDVRRVTVRDCTYNGTHYGFQVKTCRGRGGVVEDVVLDGLTMTSVTHPVELRMYFGGTIDPPGAPVPPVTEATPIVRNITLRRITATGAFNTVRLLGLPESPITGVVIEDCDITGSKPPYLLCEQGTQWRNCRISPALVTGTTTP